MTGRRGRRSRLLACAVALTAGALAAAPGGALARSHQPAGAGLDWTPCGEEGAECATAVVPADYDRPNGKQLHIGVARSPAIDAKHRIGSLFFNFGGPGAPTTDYIEANGQSPDNFMHLLNQRFDLVGMDPRGTGKSDGLIDCKVDQETQGIYSEPVPTPFSLDVPALVRKDAAYVRRCVALNQAILPYASTANVARDMDKLRRAVGDDKLTYLGFSYGSFLGATYASLFPGKMRALVLDGLVDADQYIHRPMQGLIDQTGAFERELGRFFQACAADQVACSGFGGKDPHEAYDALIDRASATPILAPGYASDPRPVTGDDVRFAAFAELYSKSAWGDLALALAQADHGDASALRRMVDEDWYGRDPDTGAFDPGSDAYFALSAIEQRYRGGNVPLYLQAGDNCWGQFDHFWVNCGYVELNFSFWPIRARDVFGGPFHVPRSAATPLLVNTTYDPATPYRGGLRLAHQLGNARLLTQVGDGHTAYGGSSACIDTAVEAYLIDRVLPPVGKRCAQDVEFTAPEPVAAASRAARRASVRRVEIRPHVKPIVR